jgi:nucleotide-binding universal stress UspA family protein
MSVSQDYSAPIIDRILHPSDFSAASEVAFAHALKAALIAQSQLTLMHVSPGMTAEWTDFPGVRETLARWGLLPPDSPRSAVPALGIDVRKVIAHDNNPVQSVLAFLRRYPIDLIVLATHQHEGRSRWLQHSVSEPIARQSGQMTLFISHGVEGFVSRQDGSVSLRHILIPIAPIPRAQPAIAAAVRLAQRLQCPAGTFTTLFVGAPGDAPAVRCPAVPGWQWNSLVKSGNVIDAIVQTASDMDTNLIVMSTDGRNGFLDALRGSHSERVLRRTPCPLLAIPVEATVTPRLSASQE